MNNLAISIRNYDRNNYKTIINSIKKAGFKNVFIEWYNNDLELQQKILDYVVSQNLNIIFAHLGYQNPNSLWLEGTEGDKEVERYINDIETCKNNGINLVVIHPTREYDDPGMRSIGLDRIKRIVNYAESKNIKVAFENIELPGYLEYIIENIKSENLGICFDVGHCNLFFDGKFDVEKFRDKVFVIHAHDNFKKMDDHNLPFDGNINWNNTIIQLINLNYDGYIVIESGYNEFYKNIGIDEFYKKAYDVGCNLNEMIKEAKQNI